MENSPRRLAFTADILVSIFLFYQCDPTQSNTVANPTQISPLLWYYYPNLANLLCLTSTSLISLVMI